VEAVEEILVVEAEQVATDHLCQANLQAEVLQQNQLYLLPQAQQHQLQLEEVVLQRLKLNMEQVVLQV
jgi:hypothetical protein